MQYEGSAEPLSGRELVACKLDYFAVWPDGRERERWPDIAYVRVRREGPLERFQPDAAEDRGIDAAVTSRIF